MEPRQSVSALWYLLPFFLLLLGGVIAYLAVKNKNSKTAENLLIFGAVWTALGLIFFAALTGYIFGLLAR